MVAVNEINVGVAGRAEQDRGAGCVASGGMRGRVVDAEVGFDFDDASGETQLAGVAEKDLAEEVASYAARAAGEEGASERVRHKSGCSQRGAEAPALPRFCRHFFLTVSLNPSPDRNLHVFMEYPSPVF